MPVTKAQQRAVSKYMKANYDELKLRIPKGQKATVQARAEQEGESVNGYVNRAILDRMGLEDWPQEGEGEVPGNE